MKKGIGRKGLLKAAVLTAALLTAGSSAFTVQAADGIEITQVSQKGTQAPSVQVSTKKAWQKDRVLVRFDEAQLTTGMKTTGGIEWLSSNTKVAGVDRNGVVHAYNEGKCVITAHFYVNTPSSSTEYYFYWNVYVNPLKLNATDITLVQRRKGYYLSLNNGRTRQASWSSSRPSVASVNGKGHVKPKNPGTTVISAKWNGFTLTCRVNVSAANADSLRNYRSPKANSNRRKVVLAGSGILDHWTKAYSAFGSTTVINNAVPYSGVDYWNKWCRRLITDYKPKAVVFCLGTEDINTHAVSSGVECASKMKELIRKVHGNKNGKNAKLFVVSIPMNPDKEEAWEEIKDFNRLMKEYCAGKKYVTYIDLNKALLNGTVPEPAHFAEGHAYLSASGYNIMKNTVAKKVRKAIR